MCTRPPSVTKSRQDSKEVQATKWSETRKSMICLDRWRRPQLRSQSWNGSKGQHLIESSWKDSLEKQKWQMISRWRARQEILLSSSPYRCGASIPFGCESFSRVYPNGCSHNLLMAYFPLLLQQMVPLFAYGSEAAEFILAVSGPKLDLYSAYPNKVKPLLQEGMSYSLQG